MRSRVVRLLSKDFITLRREPSAAFAGLVMIIVFPLLASAPGIPTLVITVFVLSMCGVNVFSIEEKYHTERFFASLAVRRREIVLARYAGTLVVEAMYFTLAFFYNGLEIVLGNHLVHPISLGYCALLFAAVALVTAISFPLYFMLGIMKARFVTIVLYIVPVMFVGAVGGLGIGRGSWAFLSVFGASPGASFPVDALTSGLIAGAALLLWLISIPIAVRLYEKRDL